MNQHINLMEQLMRLDMLLHRYVMFNLRMDNSIGNPYKGQGRVLSILKMKPEITQKELGYLLDIRNQSLGEILNKLEKNGFIVRNPSQEDRRTTNIKLTPEGEKAAEEVVNTKHSDDLFSSLNEEEQLQFSKYLDQITAELEGILSDTEPELKEFDEHMKKMFNQFISSQNGSEGNSFHPVDGMPFPGEMNFPPGFQHI